MITSIQCVDGKRHNWRDLEVRHHYGDVNYTSWCTKCGSITEFYKNHLMKRRERCYEGSSKDLYIEIPKKLKE